VTINPESIARAVADAPAWAVLGLSVRSERMREDARRALGEHVYAALYRSIDVETDQLALPL
jgi:hypothetical protein